MSAYEGVAAAAAAVVGSGREAACKRGLDAILSIGGNVASYLLAL